ncbi:cytidyltransferase [Amycolatopsis deserti]|uniref:cytidyltransferase n=1 Tax=Amycolatopsis deserti TaxID=185696 RepID=UPI001E337747|nr:cytidyltransferase [Amycolatopsis deserti]
MLWRALGEVPAGFGPSVVTLGVFDGVHRGHARLIDRAVGFGRARNLPAVLVTFDPHPARVLGLPRDTAALSTVERRADLAFGLGIRAVCVLPFTREFAALSPSEFVERALVERLRAEAVVVGADLTFGHRAAGTVDTLRELGEQRGFTTHGVGLLPAEAGVRCSSTHVRACLRRGDVRGAARALGRPHHVEGTFRPDGHGRTELVVASGTALPAPGRYWGRLGGLGPLPVWVTGEQRVIVPVTSVRPGPGGIDFVA